jgi:hypothetical protein
MGSMRGERGMVDLLYPNGAWLRPLFTELEDPQLYQKVEE